MGIGGGLAAYLCMGGMRPPPKAVERASHVEMEGASIEEGEAPPFARPGTKCMGATATSRTPSGASTKGSLGRIPAGGKAGGRAKRGLQTGTLLSAEEAAHHSSSAEHYGEDTPTVIEGDEPEDVFGGPATVSAQFVASCGALQSTLRSQERGRGLGVRDGADEDEEAGAEMSPAETKRKKKTKKVKGAGGSKKNRFARIEGEGALLD